MQNSILLSCPLRGLYDATLQTVTLAGRIVPGNVVTINVSLVRLDDALAHVAIAGTVPLRKQDRTR